MRSFWMCLIFGSLLFHEGAVTAESPNESIQVFVLAGQSNMEGKGLPTHLDTYRDDPLIKDTYDVLKQDDQWVVREDVWITYPTKSRGAKHGMLTVGYGTKGVDSIGPEFGFGHTIGEAMDSPVLLIKIAWGGKSVAFDFRPPSAGLPADAVLEKMLTNQRKRNPTVTRTEIEAAAGHYYREMIKEIKHGLANFQVLFPELAGRNYELAGFVWHQGFNDKVNRELRENRYADYTTWLAMMIRDLRRDLDAPRLPVVIGELSTGGIPGRGDFQLAQKNTADLPDLKGNVVFVPTAEFYDTKAHELYEKNYWKGTDEQKAEWAKVGNDRPYHYLGSGKTYYLKGQAFAQAMLELLKES